MVFVPALCLADRVATRQSTSVNAIVAEVRERPTQGKEVVSLMRVELDLSTPPHLLEGSTRALRNGRTSRLDNCGNKVCRAPVARKLQRDHGLGLHQLREGLERILEYLP